MPTSAARSARLRVSATTKATRASHRPRPLGGLAMLLAGSLALAGCAGSSQATQPAETPRPTDNGSLFDLAQVPAMTGTVRVRVGTAAERTLPAVLTTDPTNGTIRAPETASAGEPGGSGAPASGAPAASAAATDAAAPAGSPSSDTTVEISWSRLTNTGRVGVSGPDPAIASLLTDCVQSLEQASPSDVSGTIQCQARPTARSTALVSLSISFEFGDAAAD